MIQSRKISFGDKEYEVEPINGDMVDREFYPSEVSVDGIELEVEGVVWEEIDSFLMGAIINRLKKLEPVDTCSKNYTHSRIINGGTNKKRVLTSIYRLMPCTTKMIDTELNLEHSSSPYVSELKDEGLVACVGHHENSQIIVATHVGVKELFCIDGTPNPYENTREHHGEEGSGLKNLFDKKEEESEAEKQEDAA